MMKKILCTCWALVALSFLAGCTTFQGTVVGDRYTSLNNSFEVKIPYVSEDLRIQDGSSQYGEFVQFDLEYAYSHRIERFRKQKQVLAQIDENQDESTQLQQFKDQYLTQFQQQGVTTDVVLREEEVIIDGQKSLLLVLQISMPNYQRIRGVMLFVTDSRKKGQSA